MDPYTNKIKVCERELGVDFDDRQRCLEALQMSGHVIVWQGQSLRIRKNDRLAVLGDTLIRTVLCELWYDTTLSKGKNTVFDM